MKGVAKGHVRIKSKRGRAGELEPVVRPRQNEEPGLVEKVQVPNALGQIH